MIEDKATEKWKEEMKKKGLIVNMGAGKAEPKSKTGGKANAKGNKKNKK
ncbi:MAG: hypothetical protein ICV60_11025 [Pyrinomonadaceae bacterium]|nr:hypothetical protein [Pyrinomonadaceae bacterium]